MGPKSRDVEICLESEIVKLRKLLKSLFIVQPFLVLKHLQTVGCPLLLLLPLFLQGLTHHSTDWLRTQVYHTSQTLRDPPAFHVLELKVSISTPNLLILPEALAHPHLDPKERQLPRQVTLPRLLVGPLLFVTV